jgi:RNA polymerase sigma-70 factor, ECF subfamily
MAKNAPEELRRIIEAIYRSESGRILATLVRLLGDLDVAEEAMHEAFAAALDSWTQSGVPDKPRPWPPGRTDRSGAPAPETRPRWRPPKSDRALPRRTAPVRRFAC